MPPTTMTFEQAVAHVRAAGATATAAYAFVPTERRGALVGGAIYAVIHDDGAEPGEEPVVVAYMAGTFGSGEGAVELYEVDEAPEEALDLRYEPSASYEPTLPDYDTEVALAVLRGASLDEALAAFTAADRTAGPNGTHEARTADLLLDHGMPAVLPTPAGPLPAVVVLLDDDDPRLGQLVDAFGGVVVETAPPPGDETDEDGESKEADEIEEADRSEEADELGDEPDPADDGSEPGLPNDDDEDDEDDENDEAVGEAAWVGVGRGAVFAAGLAAWALPEWEGDLPDDLAEGWRALVAFAAAAAASPPDAAGRRPKAVYQELRRLGAKVDRVVARQIQGHEALMASLAAAVAQEIADGTFVPADFVLPTPAELAAAHPDSKASS